MNYELIKAAVAAVIKENGNEEITGNLLQQVLHSIINILGVGYQYMGMATPSTAPGTPDARQFYFAAEEGAYSNFSTSPITELDGRELAIFYYDTAWHVIMTGVATRDAMVGYAFYGLPLASGSVITGIDENTFFLVGPGTYTINGYSATISTPGISILMYDVSLDELTDYTLFPYDTTPTAGSTKPVTSGGVKAALDGKIDKVPDALTGEIPVFDGDGGLDGSTKFLSDYATQDDLDEVNARIDIVAGEAGLAEAVIDTDGAGAEQEFTFRKSGGDGGAYYRKIKGKTIVVDDQLASNDAEAVETTGANQWNEEWELGKIYASNGQNLADNNAIRTKGYIPIFPNTSYYARSSSPVVCYRRFYDADKNYLGESTVIETNTNAEFTTPAGAYYMRFYMAEAYGTTYNHDICINFSNPAINGQYFPYWKRTLQLGITTKEDTDGNVPFADGMKDAGTAADWADKVGGEKRIGRVDLGSLNWALYNGQLLNQTPLTPLARAVGTNPLGYNIICSRYRPTSATAFGNLLDGEIALGTGANDTLRIVDSSISAGDIVSGKIAKLNGVMLDYELATPVPFTWAEPLNLGVKVDENGTEKAVAPEGATAPSAPFVADTTYTMSVARMVAKLNTI